MEMNIDALPSTSKHVSASKHGSPFPVGSPPQAKRVKLDVDQLTTVNSEMDESSRSLSVASDRNTDVLISTVLIQITSHLSSTDSKDSFLQPLTFAQARKFIADFSDHEKEFWMTAIKKGMAGQGWADLVAHPRLQVDAASIQPKQYHPQVSSALPLHPSRLEAAHKAWSDVWLGDSDVLLANLMDRLHKHPDRPGYNHSLAIIQSSGMGKSRLVDSIATMKFCFPFDIRGSLQQHQFAYPPSDNDIYLYFLEPKNRTANDDAILERRYLAFFVALFENAVPELHAALNQIPASDGSIPGRWRKYLAIDATEYRVGPNRRNFYGRVITDATKRLLDVETSVGQWQDEVIKSGETFLTALRGHLEQSTNEFDNPLSIAEVPLFMYFDEAHVLTQVEQIEGQTRPHSRYHLLGRVLARMKPLPFFTVFLSTNSWLGSFAPSASKHPSLRDWDNFVLHAPFTELPFDIFADNSFGILSEEKGAVRLEDVCTLAYIVKFGRPLWYSLYKCGNAIVKWEMVDFAKVKLTKGENSKDALIVAMSNRLIIDFDIARESARSCGQRLVESYMRVVFAVPDHLEFMRSGTPSEPLLAEAAAQFLNAEGKFSHNAPDLLAELLDDGFLARGERGEMVGRIFWTVAHDAVINERIASQRPDPNNITYHKPILFLDWLKALVAPRWHPVVLNAKPIADPYGPTLESAFEDVYLNFSHFARADDFAVIGPKLLWISLSRGFAYQCPPNQESIDLAAAMHHGGLQTPLSPGNTSRMNGQLRNRQTYTDVLINPNVGGPPINDLPTFSIIHDVGLHGNRVYSHALLPAKGLQGKNRSENIHLRHYQIHIEGCSHETYAVVPKEKDDVYKLILASTKLGHDFPRNSFPEHRDAMVRQKPAFSGSEKEAASSLGWFNHQVSTFSAAGKQKGKQEATATVPPLIADDPTRHRNRN